MDRTVIGIDPGLTGGLVAISTDGLDLLVTPTFKVGKKREIDEQKIVSWLMHHALDEPLVIIERVHAMPKQGVTSMFTFGIGWGQVRGICAGMGLSYALVRPQEWQKTMLVGQPKGSEYAVASRLWPHAEWRASERCKNPHDGLVDAALIAEYGRRINH